MSVIGNAQGARLEATRLAATQAPTQSSAAKQQAPAPLTLPPDTVEISKAGKAASEARESSAQEAQETSAQTAKESEPQAQSQVHSAPRATTSQAQQTALQEAQETPAQTAKEAAKGDSQAKRLLAQEAAAKKVE